MSDSLRYFAAEAFALHANALPFAVTTPHSCVLAMLSSVSTALSFASCVILNAKITYLI